MNVNTNTGISAYQTMSAYGAASISSEEVEDRVEDTVSSSASTNKDTFEISSEAQELRAMADAMLEAHDEGQVDQFSDLLGSMISKQDEATSGLYSMSSDLMLAAAGMSNDASFNISENGSYGVAAVSDRIMNMALSIAGDDPEKLEEMKEAVIKGFEAAGLKIDDEGKTSGLPTVSLNTFDEIMKRFDYASSNNNSLDGYKYTAYDGSGNTTTLNGSNSYSTNVSTTDFNAISGSNF